MRELRILIIGAMLLSACQNQESKPESNDFTQYVNPFIGTSKMGHTFPGATAPFGMVQLSPQTNFEVMTTWEIVDDSNPYFLIGAKYVNEIMEGKFPNSLIILGGCSTLYNPTLANALIDRGASSVIGWDNLVGSSNNDQSMLAFLENHLIDDMEIKDAIDAAMSKYGKSTKYEVTLSFLSSD